MSLRKGKTPFYKGGLFYYFLYMEHLFERTFLPMLHKEH